MYRRLLISAAVRSCSPPAGISGWCMCSAIAKAALDPRERIPSIGERDHRAVPSVRDRRGDQRVLARQVGQPVDALSKLLPSYG